MISNMKIYIVEIVISIIGFLLVLFILQAKIDSEFLEVVTRISKELSANLFQLNSAIIIAFAIGLIMNKAFRYKGRDLKKIAKGSTLLVLINSVAMASYPVFGLFGLVFIVAASSGNMIKFWSIARNILEVV